MRQALRPGALGGGIGMGNTCKSMADSFQCMTKPTTIKKKKSVREKKKKELHLYVNAIEKMYLPNTFRARSLHIRNQARSPFKAKGKRWGGGCGGKI